MYCQQAEEIIRNSNPDKEYLPISGLPEFTKRAALLAYGSESVPLTQGAVCTTLPGSIFLRRNICFRLR